MSCSCCKTLALFEKLFAQFNDMKASEIVQKEVESVFRQFQTIKYSDAVSYLENRYRRLSFINMIIDYITSKYANKEKMNFSKVEFTDVLTILNLEDLQKDFFFHYMFMNDSTHNLIRIEQVGNLLMRLNMANIEYFISVPAFSFTQSNYLSSLEFTDFFKTVLLCNISNDITSLTHKVFLLLDEEEKSGEVTEEKIFYILFNHHSKHEDILRLFFKFSQNKKDYASNHSKEDSLNEEEFCQFFNISCKLINRTLNNELFNIAYLRADPLFACKLNQDQVTEIVDHLSIIFHDIDKNNIITDFNNSTNTNAYFALNSILSNYIDFNIKIF